MSFKKKHRVYLLGAVIITAGTFFTPVIESFLAPVIDPLWRNLTSSSVQIKGDKNIGIGQADNVFIDQSNNTNNISPPEALLEGTLMPANEPIPEHSCGKLLPTDLKIFIGSNVSILSENRDLNIIKWQETPLLKIKREQSGAYISAKVLREDGRTVAELRDNKFTVNPNNYYVRERPDPHEIKIKDGSDNLVLRVRYINETTFWIEGEFFIPTHGMLVATNDKVSTGVLIKSSGNCFRVIDGGAVFYYD